MEEIEEPEQHHHQQYQLQQQQLQEPQQKTEQPIVNNDTHTPTKVANWTSLSLLGNTSRPGSLVQIISSLQVSFS